MVPGVQGERISGTALRPFKGHSLNSAPLDFFRFIPSIQKEEKGGGRTFADQTFADGHFLFDPFIIVK